MQGGRSRYNRLGSKTFDRCPKEPAGLANVKGQGYMWAPHDLRALDEPPDEPPDDSGDEPPPSGLTEVPPPGPVVELAESCVRFVQAATGVTLDFSPETLPVLDHYIGSRRDDLLQRPETIGLVARAAGTYFGEVVRRQIRSFWNATSDDPAVWEAEARARLPGLSSGGGGLRRHHLRG